MAGKVLEMGSDKGLFASGTGKVWAEILKGKFSHISISSIVSINPGQSEHYLKYFQGDELVVDNQSITFKDRCLVYISAHLKLCSSP